MKNSIEKASLLISDYTLTDSIEEKDSFLYLAGKYIQDIGNPEITLMYYKVCDSDIHEKEIYLEILIDLLNNAGSHNI